LRPIVVLKNAIADERSIELFDSDRRRHNSRAKRPLANGTANDVPESLLFDPGTPMFCPGAKTETKSFRVLNTLLLRFTSMDPTLIAVAQELGNSYALQPQFPAAANTRMPFFEA